MSYTFLLEQGEESSAAYFADIPASVLWKLNLTAGKYSSNDNETEFYRTSRYGMTSEHLTLARGEEWWTLFAEDFHARTSVAEPEMQKESMERDLDSGPKCEGSLAKYDQGSCSWKTRQCLLLGGLEPFSETYPDWGSMQYGELFQHSIAGPLTEENDFGLLPTPTAGDYQPICFHRVERMLNGKVACENGGGNANLQDYAALLWMKAENLSKRPQTGNRPTANPRWWENLMGWPIGWTDLKPLEMDRFQQWLDSHGRH